MGNIEQDLKDKNFERWQQLHAIISRVSLAMELGGYEFRFLKVQVPRNLACDWRVIVGAYDSSGMPVVAFTGGETLQTAIYRAFVQWQNGALKWKEDQYAT